MSEVRKELSRWNFIYQLYQRIFIAEKELEFCRAFMEDALPDTYSTKERPVKFDSYINCKWEEYRNKELDLRVKKQKNARRLRTRIFQQKVRDMAREERDKVRSQLFQEAEDDDRSQY